MQPSVLYITYATSSNEKTGDIITVSHFDEGVLLENKHNAEEYE